ncbi:MAG TPA: Hsp20/alpha crystallin family protein [Rubrivivax sp.]|nr:Hsp20/alpha crystallin family protein [Rubrivivax sp.]HPO20095.1 Hsp20/alpha crystallin family protein [Rubrivivax sp.]
MLLPSTAILGVTMFLVPMARNASELARSFDRLFDDSFERFFAPSAEGGHSALRSPALDVAESDAAYTVKLDLPGVAKEDVKVAIDGRRVSVEAQTRKDEEKKEGDRVVYRERSLASFSRSFTVAAEIDQSASAAKLENGVLTLTLSKRGAPASAQLTVD